MPENAGGRDLVVFGCLLRIVGNDSRPDALLRAFREREENRNRKEGCKVAVDSV